MCAGGIGSFFIRQTASPRFFKPISILISVCSLAVSGAACGGSEKDDEPVQESDAGIVVADSGMTENDASIIEGDSGIIENTDANIPDDDAGVIEENIEFISIPAGSFVLSHRTRLYDEGDTVTLAAFKLKTTPVTVAEFKKCVTAGACTAEHYTDAALSVDTSCNYGNLSRTNHPMNCVDWDGAKEYCAWIGGRLPTQEEWEYASTHNGTQHLDTMFPWGDNLPKHCVTAQYYFGHIKKYCQGNAATPMSNADDYEGTSDVSLHTPAGDSPLGLVDMAGNVWEWTSSLSLHSGYIVRGGYWGLGAASMDVTYSVYDDPSDRSNGIGFRCAK